MDTVYVVGWRNREPGAGFGGFEWFFTEHDAIAYRVRTDGEFRKLTDEPVEVRLFEHDTEFAQTNADKVTNEIDAIFDEAMDKQPA